MNKTGGYSCVGVNETLHEEFHRSSFKLDNCTYKQAVREPKHFKIDYYYEFTKSKPLSVGKCPPEAHPDSFERMTWLRNPCMHWS